MSGTYSIEAPYLLSSIPRPLDPSKGIVQTGPSTTVAGSKKRKRSEIVVAADGEAISLHSVKSPRLITSHPISPNLRFTAPPTCCCIKFNSRKSTDRLIYAATSNGTRKSKNELIHIHESLSRSSSSQSTGAHQPRKTTVNVGSAEDPVIFQDVIPSNDLTSSDRVDVITVQRGGDIVCFSQELDKEHWRQSVSTLRNASTHIEPAYGIFVEYAEIFDSTIASSGVFKRRPDVAELLQFNPDREVKNYTSILCLVTRSGPKSTPRRPIHRLCLYAIRPRWSVPNQRSALQLLSAAIIPVPNDAGKAPSRSSYSFDPSTGHLQCLGRNSIIVYTFDDVLPKFYARIETSNETPVSFVALDASTVLVNTQEHLRIYDVRYHSVQATQSTVLAGEKRKQKQSQSGPGVENLTLLAFHRDLGFAIGIKGESLIGIDIRIPTVQGSKAGSRLIDAYGKGLEGTRPNPNKSPAKLTQSEQELNHFVNVNDVRRFDEEFPEFIGPEYWNQCMARLKESKDLRLYHPSIQQHLEEMDHSKAKTPRQEIESSADIYAKSLYALSKIFGWNTTKASRPLALIDRPSALNIKFLPPTVLIWLSMEGHLVPSTIEAALRLRNDPFRAFGTLKYLDIINAVANADHSLALLADFISTSPYLPLQGVLNSLSALLQSFSGPAELPTLENRLLTNGDATAGQPQLKNNPDTAKDLELLAAEEVVMEDIALVNDILESGSSHREAALQHCLEKLATCYDGEELSKSMRYHLSRREIIMLVEFLRTELNHAGWGTSYLDTYREDTAGGYELLDHGTLPAVCVLLNASLDALGTGGWVAEDLVSNQQTTDDPRFSTDPVLANSPDETNDMLREDDVVARLREDISSALEGIQESAFFQHFLKDYLRFVNVYTDSLGTSSSKKRTYDTSEELEVVQLSANKKRASRRGTQNDMLPMGLKSVQKVDSKRVGAGGQVFQKSSRHIGGIISKGVSKYSFETLEV